MTRGNVESEVWAVFGPKFAGGLLMSEMRDAFMEPYEFQVGQLLLDRGGKLDLSSLV